MEHETNTELFGQHLKAAKYLILELKKELGVGERGVAWHCNLTKHRKRIL